MLSNYFGKLNRNIIDQIQYRGTMVTGVITANNGDGTYAVKIAQSDKAHPYVETAFPDMVFGVDEVVLITFEYGNKEMPRILGYAKRIAQHPVDVEVDYSDPTFSFGIDIGSPKIDLNDSQAANYTFIAKENPANDTGKITSIELKAAPNATGIIVATFTEVSAGVFTARDHVHLADIPDGSKVTRTVDANGNPISLDVVKGDYIGIWWDNGSIEFELFLGVGTWFYGEDQTSCVNKSFSWMSGSTVSLYGIG